MLRRCYPDVLLDTAETEALTWPSSRSMVLMINPKCDVPVFYYVRVTGQVFAQERTCPM
jgi:predicted  nucleic acid-binding Zn ribbon protein